MPTITIWSDLACPWACLAVHRLWTARERLDLVEAVDFDHRVFSLEVVNSRPHPRRTYDTEIAVLADLEPSAAWQPWQGKDSEYAVSSLLALEAVQAAKAQGLAASAALDRALRDAMFAESRCITMRHVILEVAAETKVVDVDALEKALDDGTARRDVLDQHREATDDTSAVKGSPHLFVAGEDWHNPGITMHWDKAAYRPVIERDDPSAYDEILRAATS